MSKDKASEFKCNVSLKRIQASDGSYIFKSGGDEGGEGEFDDDEEEEDDCKVKIPGLNGDGDEDDAPNDRQTSKLDSKMEPDDEGDIGEEEHPKTKSQLHQGHPSRPGVWRDSNPSANRPLGAIP